MKRPISSNRMIIKNELDLFLILVRVKRTVCVLCLYLYDYVYASVSAWPSAVQYNNANN